MSSYTVRDSSGKVVRTVSNGTITSGGYSDNKGNVQNVSKKKSSSSSSSGSKSDDSKYVNISQTVKTDGTAITVTKDMQGNIISSQTSSSKQKTNSRTISDRKQALEQASITKSLRPEIKDTQTGKIIDKGQFTLYKGFERSRDNFERNYGKLQSRTETLKNNQSYANPKNYEQNTKKSFDYFRNSISGNGSLQSDLNNKQTNFSFHESRNNVLFGLDFNNNFNNNSNSLLQQQRTITDKERLNSINQQYNETRKSNLEKGYENVIDKFFYPGNKIFEYVDKGANKLSSYSNYNKKDPNFLGTFSGLTSAGLSGFDDFFGNMYRFSYSLVKNPIKTSKEALGTTKDILINPKTRQQVYQSMIETVNKARQGDPISFGKVASSTVSLKYSPSFLYDSSSLLLKGTSKLAKKPFVNKNVLIADSGEMVPLMDRARQIDFIMDTDKITTLTSRSKMFGNQLTNELKGAKELQQAFSEGKYPEWRMNQRISRFLNDKGIDVDYTYNTPIEFATWKVGESLPTSKIFLEGTGESTKSLFQRGYMKIENIPSLKLDDFTKSKIKNILYEGKSLNELDISNYYKLAKSQANQLGSPVAALSPKRLRGFGQAEMELVKVYPDKVKFKIGYPSGFTPSGQLIFDKTGLGLKSTIKSKFLSGQYDFFEQIVKDKKDYLSNVKQTLPGEYQFHGASHLLPMDKYGNKYSWHDLAKVMDHDSFSKYSHGEIMKDLWKQNKLPKEFYSLPKNEQKQLVNAYAGHEYVRFNMKSLFFKPGQEGFSFPSKKELYWTVKEKVSPNPKLQDISTLDRLDFIRFGVTPDSRFLSDKAVKRMFSDSQFLYKENIKSPLNFNKKIDLSKDFSFRKIDLLKDSSYNFGSYKKFSSYGYKSLFSGGSVYSFKNLNYSIPKPISYSPVGPSYPILKPTSYNPVGPSYPTPKPTSYNPVGPSYPTLKPTSYNPVGPSYPTPKPTSYNLVGSSYSAKTLFAKQPITRPKLFYPIQSNNQQQLQGYKVNLIDGKKRIPVNYGYPYQSQQKALNVAQSITAKQPEYQAEIKGNNIRRLKTSNQFNSKIFRGRQLITEKVKFRHDSPFENQRRFKL